jgi:23S rRNA (adenine2503-C2)-methyltransferase
MKHLLELSLDELRQWFVERGHMAFRAAQVWHAVYARRAASFEELTDLPRAVRHQLAQEFTLWTSQVATHQRAADGTEKLLLQLRDGQRIECVLLRQGTLRRTICISTQVGCGMGCVFCASGLDGVARNLTTGEIVEQMLLLNRLLAPDERLSHIVVMGMGEPLANLPHLLPALQRATDPQALGISQRRITISTVGLPAGIRRLAQLGLHYHLAVSLHAPDDTLRNRLVPVNRNIGLQAILEAADDYFRATGRRLTFEYVLLRGINDGPHHARVLGELLRGREALLNAIPFNPVAGLPYQTPDPNSVARFKQVLERAGVRVKIRQRKGDAIDAACGQLRRRADTVPIS